MKTGTAYIPLNIAKNFSEAESVEETVEPFIDRLCSPNSKTLPAPLEMNYLAKHLHEVMFVQYLQKKILFVVHCFFQSGVNVQLYRKLPGIV